MAATHNDGPRDPRSTGGAATGSGVFYQTLFAVQLALDDLSRQIREYPVSGRFLDVEPRNFDHDSITRWDVGVRCRDANVGTSFEAKENPDRGDIVAFLDQVRASVESGSTREYRLVHSTGTHALLRAIETIGKLREEAGDDRDRFAQRCDSEPGAALAEVVSLLGDMAFPTAGRIRVLHWPRTVLESNITFMCRSLVQPASQQALKDFLISRFLDAMGSRTTFRVSTLLRDARSRGISFFDPVEVVPVDLDPTTHSAIHVLQHCPDGLPTDVVRAVTRLASNAAVTSAFQDMPLVVEHGPVWRANALSAPIGHDASGALLSDALRSLIEFLNANRRTDEALVQVNNAIALARACAATRPEVAMLAFGNVDGMLKRRGRKRDVLQLAELTVEWAREVTSEKARRIEAKVLICGVSWVLQRVGELDRAHRLAIESLELGERIGWSRNTAYCRKCLGRLYRLRGERAVNGRTKAKHFNESVRSLEQAIVAFEHSDHEDRDGEIGDCHSLLGRTYLAAKNTTKAAEHASEAHERITDFSNKDYIDLLILEGDLARTQFNYPTANERFRTALDSVDPSNGEHSEIAARAWYSLASNTFDWKNDVPTARKQIRAALRIWDEIEDSYHAGMARWKLHELSHDVPDAVRRKVKPLAPPAKVEALRLYKARTARQSKTTLAQRSNLTDRAWASILEEAKRNTTIRNRRW